MCSGRGLPRLTVVPESDVYWETGDANTVQPEPESDCDDDTEVMDRRGLYDNSHDDPIPSDDEDDENNWDRLFEDEEERAARARWKAARAEHDAVVVEKEDNRETREEYEVERAVVIFVIQDLKQELFRELQDFIYPRPKPLVLPEEEDDEEEEEEKGRRTKRRRS